MRVGKDAGVTMRRKKKNGRVSQIVVDTCGEEIASESKEMAECAVQ